MSKRCNVDIYTYPDDLSKLGIYVEGEEGRELKPQEILDSVYEALLYYFDLDLTPNIVNTDLDS